MNRDYCKPSTDHRTADMMLTSIGDSLQYRQKDSSNTSTVSNNGVETDFSVNSETSKYRLSKTEKKKRRYELMAAHRKAFRRLAKVKQKANRLKRRNLLSGGVVDDKKKQDYPLNRLNKRERIRAIKGRLQDAIVSGQRICVDLGLESFMSAKECGRLAQQLCRVYGSNRKARCPAHLYFTSVDKNGFLYQECLRKNVGFENYMIDMTEKSHLEVFKHDEIIYLSPNSSNILHDISTDKVYVIGGLVDESVQRNVTHSRADQSGIETARLPISEYMDRSASGSYNQILTINQVFDILLAYMETRDWSIALPCGVPERKGFVIKDKSNGD